MLISELQKKTNDCDIIRIENERSFERFSRTTSEVDGAVCVFIGAVKYIDSVPSNATMVITTEEIAEMLSADSFGICISRNPKATYFRLFSTAGAVAQANIIETCVGKNCLIGKYVSICPNNVEIGDNVVIEDFVTIYENVSIGNNCVIRSGARIGVQDYNYFANDESLVHLPHFGKLVIEDDVEVGFNSVIGRSLYPDDTTKIGKGSKLANCCAVGHDCQIGEKVMVYAGTMIAGFVTIGDNSHITLNSTIKNGISIGKNVQVDMGSVVIRDIPDGETVFGNPARRIITPQ